MQKYLSPAMRYFSRMLPHGTEVRVFIDRHRKFVFASVAALLAISIVGMMTVRGIMTTHNQDAVTNHQVHTNGSSITSVTSGSTSISNIHVTSSPSPQTSITVNNQPIDVLQNGSVSKTITNDGSTTHVSVSHSSSQSGGSTSGSATTTTNVSTYSNNINLHSP